MEDVVRAEPNLFVIGAQRAGSTSMWRYLRAHPEIYMAEVKEPGFVCFDAGRPVFSHAGDPTFFDQIVTDADEYSSLFQPGAHARYRGESSSFYLYFEESRRALAERYPDARFVVILRDPVDRAWSSYVYLRRLGGEPLDDFGAALESEPTRIAENYEPLFHYVAASRYGQQLSALFDLIDPSRVHIMLLERLQADPAVAMAELFRFLGVDDAADVGADVQHNSAATSRIPMLNTVLSPGFLPSGVADRIPRSIKDRAVLLRERSRRGSYDELSSRNRGKLLDAVQSDYVTIRSLAGVDLQDWWPSASELAGERH